MNYDYTKWTYGCEHEFGDWDTSIQLPNSFTRADDWTLVNTNGIAVQPSIKTYPYGGEINTPPSKGILTQIEFLEELKSRYKLSVNHRSNLHIHIRIPGLKKSLKELKIIQEYIHKELPKVINIIEPIPIGKTAGEKKRARRRKISHHTFLTEKRLKYQLSSKSVKQFFEREVPQDKNGNVMWHAQPRVCVNLRQLLQTDTIEFRHFPGTLEIDKLYNCFNWCYRFLCTALSQLDVVSLLEEEFDHNDFPRFPKFNLLREIKYQATASHNGLKKSQVLENIALIKSRKFNGTQAYKEAYKRACGMSR